MSGIFAFVQDGHTTRRGRAPRDMDIDELLAAEGYPVEPPFAADEGEYDEVADAVELAVSEMLW